ncbi:MAG TPA: Hsp70 family protein [Pseudonocardia sp.]|nr:Hsp70 family protein [Pseudonocardia sp.]
MADNGALGYSLGVDLGTTFVAAAISRHAQPEMVNLGDHSMVTPSVVYLREDGVVVTSDTANRRATSEPDRAARGFKRRLGDPTPVMLGGQPHTVVDLLAALLRDVLASVTEIEGAPPEHVVLTHPANWGPFRRGLFEEVPLQVGLPNARIMTEPEAAAAHYAATRRLADGQIIAVYDLGGGTFDVTVVRKRPDGIEILGVPEGIERLGGIDFDDAVLSHVDYACGGALSELDPRDPEVAVALNRLRQDCVLAKETLSVDTEVTVPVWLPGRHLEVQLTRSEFEDLIRAQIESTVGALSRTLRSAQVEPAELTAVLLVGGSSRIPLVGRMVSEELGRPTVLDTHPKYAVALGAAVLADLATEVPSAAPSARTASNGAASNGAAWDDGGRPNGVLMNGVQVNGVQRNGVRVNGAQVNGSRINGAGANGAWVTGAALPTFGPPDAQPAAGNGAPPRQTPAEPSADPVATAIPIAADLTVAPTTAIPIAAGSSVDTAAPTTAAPTVLGHPARPGTGYPAGPRPPAIPPQLMRAPAGRPPAQWPSHPTHSSAYSPATPPYGQGRIGGWPPGPSDQARMTGPADPSGPGKPGAKAGSSQSTDPRTWLRVLLAATIAMVIPVVTFAVLHRGDASPAVPTPALPAASTPAPNAPAVPAAPAPPAVQAPPAAAAPGVAATIPVGARPNGITVTPDGKHAFVLNDPKGPGTVSVVDTVQNTAPTKIPVAAGSARAVFTPDGRTAYVTNFADAGAVSVVDVAASKVTATIGVPAKPNGLAISPDARHLYVASSTPGVVTVIDTAGNKVVASIPVRKNPDGVALTPDGRHAYVTNFGSDSVSVIDTASNQVTATVPVQNQPVKVAISPDGSHAYVTNHASGSVSVIDIASNKVTATVPVNQDPSGVTITPDGRQVYVSNTGSGTVSVLDTATAAVTATLPVGGAPIDVAMCPDGHNVYIANRDGGTVAVLHIG